MIGLLACPAVKKAKPPAGPLGSAGGNASERAPGSCIAGSPRAETRFRAHRHGWGWGHPEGPRESRWAARRTSTRVVRSSPDLFGLWSERSPGKDETSPDREQLPVHLSPDG